MFLLVSEFSEFQPFQKIDYITKIFEKLIEYFGLQKCQNHGKMDIFVIFHTQKPSNFCHFV